MFENFKKKKSKADKPRLNVPSVDAPTPQLTLADLDHDMRGRVSRIRQEFINGFHFIKKHPKSVTFFGSARFDEEHPYYKKARSIATRLAKEGYDVVTGGGPGIMEAGNRGAQESGEGGKSLGFSIELPREQILNEYVDDHVDFYYFFPRKVLLTFSSEAYIYFPGGFGTMDEFFEILTLVQTEKIPRVPIICVGDDYWGRVRTFFDELLSKDYETIDHSDLDLITITEDEDKIVEIVKNAPLRKE